MERGDHDRLDDDIEVNPSANPTFQAVLAARMSRRGLPRRRRREPGRARDGADWRAGR